MKRIRVIDTHTGGEPTRIVLDPAGAGIPLYRDPPTLAEDSILPSATPSKPARLIPSEVPPLRYMVLRLREEHDWLRRTVVLEPRGSEIAVGALLLAPYSSSAAAAAVFFNNTGYLGMCGHGTVGLAVALHHLGRLAPGDHVFETPVGDVGVRLHDAHRVTVENVPAYRHAKDVSLDVSGLGRVMGDIAWGGNWFFLAHGDDEAVRLGNVARLDEATRRIARALDAQGIRGEDGARIDHIELFGPPSDPEKADSRNFVLCPGGHYDRSPCGTGTCAKLACLAEDGRLEEGEVWRQESITGSIFEASYHRRHHGAHATGRRVVPSGVIHPSITGTAFVTAEAELLLDPEDPFATGIPRESP